MRKAAYLIIIVTTILSCTGKGYQDRPFGGMNGRVQEVLTYHRMPEMWYAGNTGTDVMFSTKSVYDLNGFEICSALIDSGGRIQSEAESMFEKGVCIRSTQKAGGRITARINLVSDKKGQLEYTKEAGGKIIRMVVKESSFMRRHKSLVYEDGILVSENKIRTNSKGLPETVTIIDHKSNVHIVETNMYDKDGNIIEKHITRSDERKEQIVYTDYFDPDEHGNWTEARTYNKNRLPEYVETREIKYWE